MPDAPEKYSRNTSIRLLLYTIAFKTHIINYDIKYVAFVTDLNEKLINKMLLMYFSITEFFEFILAILKTAEKKENI